MSHLQPFSIDIFAEFSTKIVGFTRISAFHRPFFQEATAMESTTAVVTVVAFTNVWRHIHLFLCYFTLKLSQIHQMLSSMLFYWKKLKRLGEGLNLFVTQLLDTTTSFFFSKKQTTKLKEKTTSKTVSFCWCNICTESFGIRFLYLRPSTTCDL